VRKREGAFYTHRHRERERERGRVEAHLVESLEDEFLAELLVALRRRIACHAVTRRRITHITHVVSIALPPARLHLRPRRRLTKHALHATTSRRCTPQLSAPYPQPLSPIPSALLSAPYPQLYSQPHTLSSTLSPIPSAPKSPRSGVGALETQTTDANHRRREKSRCMTTVSTPYTLAVSTPYTLAA